MSPIRNAGNIPLSRQTLGEVPDMSGALSNQFQPMIFNQVTKTVGGFVVSETGNPLNFRGVLVPFSGRELLMRPEGERKWAWHWLYSDTALGLNPDDVVVWRGVQYRVMSSRDRSLYSFHEYTIVQDYTQAGPN